MTCVLYAGKSSQVDTWRESLLSLRPDLDLRLDVAATEPGEVDILLYEGSGPIEDLTPYGGVAAIQSLWAGVEVLLANPTLPKDTVLCRMVESGLTEAMTDYVVGHVMRAHLGMDGHRERQAKREWSIVHAPLSSERKVGIVGLGALGRDAAEMLKLLRFDVSGWSRSAKDIEGVRCLHGAEGLKTLLSESQIIVLLAPLTLETEDLLDAERISWMPQGSHIINAARGQLIDDDALLEALNSGQIESATLDVFRQEPLPENHPYWGHPSVTITPHIASVTRAATAAKTVVEQIERFERGEPFAHTVDHAKGY